MTIEVLSVYFSHQTSRKKMSLQAENQSDLAMGRQFFRVDSADVFDLNDSSNLKMRLQACHGHNSGVSPDREQGEDDSRQVAIDFAGVTTLSSANLNGLIQANRQARELEYAVVLVNVGDSIRDILSLTRLDRLFTLECAESLDEKSSNIDETVLA
jgi:ABC-type transporter Mla MlaB component